MLHLRVKSQIQGVNCSKSRCGPLPQNLDSHRTQPYHNKHVEQKYWKSVERLRLGSFRKKGNVSNPLATSFLSNVAQPQPVTDFEEIYFQRMRLTKRISRYGTLYFSLYCINKLRKENQIPNLS